MKRAFIGAGIVLLVSLGTAAGQVYPPPGGGIGGPYVGAGAGSLVASWYTRFLRRQMDFGAQAWVNQLRAGRSPVQVLAAILGGQEYYLLAGATPEGFLTTLYQDLTGSPPQPAQMTYWLNGMRFTSRRDVAYNLLLFYSGSWQTPAPAPLYSYRHQEYYPHYPYYGSRSYGSGLP